VTLVGGRLALAWIALPLLEGCGFGVPLRQPTVVPDQAARGATLRLGEATRSDVRAALGEPRLESGFWRAELYRADDKRTELGFMVAVVIPVPVGVFSEKRHGHVLVVYDDAGRVAGVASGVVGDGILATDAESWMTLHAGAISFVVDPVGTKQRATMLADAARLAEYLAARRNAAGCTLVAGCDGEGGCPDRLAIDGGEPLDPSPVTALCAPDAPCPIGSAIPGAPIDGKHFVIVPVLLAIDVPAGVHLLRVTSSRIEGGGEASFECGAGEVRYALVRSRVRGKRFWSQGTLEAVVTYPASAPADWDARSLELVRDGRWLVEREPR
jgi:hypothetical protein